MSTVCVVDVMSCAHMHYRCGAADESIWCIERGVYWVAEVSIMRQHCAQASRISDALCMPFGGCVYAITQKTFCKLAIYHRVLVCQFQYHNVTLLI